MPEAVIVAATRSPIGRAFKGALKDTLPDQLAAMMVQAALDHREGGNVASLPAGPRCASSGPA